MGPGCRFAALCTAGWLPALLLAGGPELWVPARWDGDFGPRTLALLENTPVNCLLVKWGAPQKDIAGYVLAAHERRIAIVGLLSPGADPEPAAAGAIAAGLDGLALEDSGAEFAARLRSALRNRNSSMPVIPIGAWKEVAADPDRPVLAANDAVSSRVRVFSESGGVSATPSSEPWIDSNLWLVRWLRALSGPRPVWLAHRIERPAADDYLRAVAEAAAAGGRWVVPLDDTLAASNAWRRLAGCLRFHEQHAEWQAFSPVAALAVIQDDRAADADMSAENLNLVARRRIPFRVVERSRLTAAAIEGVAAVLATDLDPPRTAEREILSAFARKGGLLVVGPSWASLPPGKGEYAITEHGSGRIAAYRKGPPDPETVARDVAEWIGNDNLPVRLYHVASVLAHSSLAPDGRLLVQLVNYATEASDQITVRVAGEFRRARLYRPDAPAVDLKTIRSGSRTDVRIETMAVYAAVLFES